MTDDLRRRMHDQQLIFWLRRIDTKLASLDVRLQMLAEICDRMTGWKPLDPNDSLNGLQTTQDVPTMDDPYSRE